MTVILGIDPGSRITGYGFLVIAENKIRHLAHGTIKTPAQDTHQRLYFIAQQLNQLIETHHPTEAAIEQVFVKHNVQSALKLGQARGVAMAATAKYELELAEYSPRAIKKAVTGYGGADKKQVQQMIKSLLQLKETPQADAADALAIALCHAHTRQWKKRLSAAQG